MVETINIIPYAVYSSTYDLKTTSLYSGGENDPIINAKMHALDYLSFDKEQQFYEEYNRAVLKAQEDFINNKI